MSLVTKYLDLVGLSFLVQLIKGGSQDERPIVGQAIVGSARLTE